MARWNKAKTPRVRAAHFDATMRIEKLEAAVVYRTVTRDFTVPEVLRWLYPEPIIEALRGAYNYAHYKGSFIDEENCLIVATDTRFSLRISNEHARMLTPEHGCVVFQPHHEQPVRGLVEEIAAIHASFNIVRKVVDWLNDGHATVGAARFYCPWLGTLLPAEHAFHGVEGLKYKDLDTTDISAHMRAAAAIVAGGLLADPDHIQNNAAMFGVTISNPNGRKSQRFMII